MTGWPVARACLLSNSRTAIAATRAFKNDDLFRMHVEVAAPPSRTTVQRVIVSDPSEPGIGRGTGISVSSVIASSLVSSLPIAALD